MSISAENSLTLLDVKKRLVEHGNNIIREYANLLVVEMSKEGYHPLLATRPTIETEKLFGKPEYLVGLTAKSPKAVKGMHTLRTFRFSESHNDELITSLTKATPHAFLEIEMSELEENIDLALRQPKIATLIDKYNNRRKSVEKAEEIEESMNKSKSGSRSGSKMSSHSRSASGPKRTSVSGSRSGKKVLVADKILLLKDLLASKNLYSGQKDAKLGSGLVKVINDLPGVSVDMSKDRKITAAIQSIGKDKGISITVDGKWGPNTQQAFEQLKESLKTEQPEDAPTSTGDGRNYWWLQANPKTWKVENLKIGEEDSYSTRTKNNTRRRIYENFFEAKKGELLIIYESSPTKCIKAIARITKEAVNKDGDELKFKVVHFFEKQTSWNDLLELDSFKKSTLVKNNQGSLFKLNQSTFEDVLKTTEVDGETLVSLTNQINVDSSGSGDPTIHYSASVRQSNDFAHAEKDHLGFDKDIKVFAALMALKSLEPPMAIALFGKWGSGKSFFMHHLERRIKELSEHQGFVKDVDDPTGMHIKSRDDEKYCKGIVHISFNAWSYLDANLWAGLVNSIFEKLNEYLTENTKSNVARLKVQQKLTERLAFLYEQRGEAYNEKEGLVKIKKAYKSEQKRLQDNLQKDRLQLAAKLLVNEPGLVSKIEKMKETKLFKELDELPIEEIKSNYKVMSTFARNVLSWQFLKNKWFYLITFLIGLAVLYMTRSEADYVIPSILSSLPLSKLVDAIASTFGQQGKINTYKKYMERFNTLIADDGKLDKEMKGMKKKIKGMEQQIAEAEKEICTFDDKIKKAEHKLQSDITGQAVADFISERSNSDEYTQHLGIVSTIRKDFETLSQLFQERNEEEKAKEILKGNGEMVKDSEEIKEQFNDSKKLERVILYIDDLDRCSDEKVLEILQAVHLLMAFPLFIVVVGVDKKCVNNALNYRNVLRYCQLTGVDSPRELESKFGITIIEPNDYLEKIFQIPFQLQEPEDDGVHKMIDALFKGQVEAEVLKDVNEDGEPDEEEMDNPEEVDEANEQGTEQEIMDQRVDPPTENVGPQKPLSTKVPEEEEPIKEVEVLSPPDLTISRQELIDIKAVSVIVGKSPRTIKRFVNLYRLIRAHENMEYNNITEQQELLGIMFLLALTVGDHKAKFQPILERLRSEKISKVSEVITESSNPPLHKIISENTSLLPLFDLSCEIINKHADFVKRFSFGRLIIPLHSDDSKTSGFNYQNTKYQN